MAFVTQSSSFGCLKLGLGPRCISMSEAGPCKCDIIIAPRLNRVPHISLVVLSITFRLPIGWGKIQGRPSIPLWRLQLWPPARSSTPAPRWCQPTLIHRNAPTHLWPCLCFGDPQNEGLSFWIPFRTSQAGVPSTQALYERNLFELGLFGATHAHSGFGECPKNNGTIIFLTLHIIFLTLLFPDPPSFFLTPPCFFFDPPLLFFDPPRPSFVFRTGFAKSYAAA